MLFGSDFFCLEGGNAKETTESNAGKIYTAILGTLTTGTAGEIKEEN